MRGEVLAGGPNLCCSLGVGSVDIGRVGVCVSFDGCFWCRAVYVCRWWEVVCGWACVCEG